MEHPRFRYFKLSDISNTLLEYFSKKSECKQGGTCKQFCYIDNNNNHKTINHNPSGISDQAFWKSAPTELQMRPSHMPNDGNGLFIIAPTYFAL